MIGHDTLPRSTGWAVLPRPPGALAAFPLFEPGEKDGVDDLFDNFLGVDQALERYEHNQRPHATRSQATAAPGGELLIPATQEQIDARNRSFSPTSGSQVSA